MCTTAELICFLIFAYQYEEACYFHDMAHIHKFTIAGSTGRRLRHPKRFMAIPSPITAVEWWRVGGTLSCNTIRKTCPCNVYPLEPHFYIAKLGYARVYLFFLFLLQNIDCGYSLEPPQHGGSNVYPQSML